jgi:hypothetical protein
VTYEHPLASLLGLEGVALMRGFIGEYDRDRPAAVHPKLTRSPEPVRATGSNAQHPTRK